MAIIQSIVFNNYSPFALSSAELRLTDNTTGSPSYDSYTLGDPEFIYNSLTHSFEIQTAFGLSTALAGEIEMWFDVGGSPSCPKTIVFVPNYELACIGSLPVDEFFTESINNDITDHTFVVINDITTCKTAIIY